MDRPIRTKTVSPLEGECHNNITLLLAISNDRIITPPGMMRKRVPVGRSTDPPLAGTKAMARSVHAQTLYRRGKRRGYQRRQHDPRAYSSAVLARPGYQSTMARVRISGAPGPAASRVAREVGNHLPRGDVIAAPQRNAVSLTRPDRAARARSHPLRSIFDASTRRSSNHRSRCALAPRTLLRRS
jgi:hypothetical protein